MIKSGKRLKPRKIYSEDFKLKIVKFYESGKHTVSELEKIYDISNPTIYKWIYKYSKYNKKSVKVVEFKDSEMSKINEMQARIAELEQALGQKQMNIDYLEKMIELAKQDYDIDIKKNSSTLQSGGSKTTKKN